MDEVIRKGVELANGFEPYQEGVDVFDDQGRLDVAVGWEDMPDWFLDALAMQLARQVRQAGWPHDNTPDAFRLRTDFYIAMERGEALDAIRTIVESGVLE